MAKTAAWLGAGYLVLFTLISSWILLAGTGLADQYDFPESLWHWWPFLFSYYDDEAGLEWILLSGVPAALVSTMAIAVFFIYRWQYTPFRGRRSSSDAHIPDPPARGITDNYGHARWATIPEMKSLWPGPDPLYGGLVVGEAYDPRADDGPFTANNKNTWGRGGGAPLLIDPCHEGSTHAMVIAGSGSYKTTSCAIPTLLTWTGAAVVLDPATEIGPMVGEHRRRRMGHRVFVLDPETAAACGFNVLDWINISSPLAEGDVSAVVEWICGYTAKRDQTAQFFKDGGKRLITCLLAHILWDPDLPPELKTMFHLRNAISVPETELRDILKAIHQTSASPLARHLAGPLCKLVAETFSGIFANAAEDTSWLSIRAYADLVSGSAFKAEDIINGTVDVFVALPLKAMDATPAVARCIVGALLNAVYEANGNLPGRVLFLLDEAAMLGYMRVINVARDAGRKYGITLFLLYQSVGQIIQQWSKEGKDAWYEAVTWRSYAGIKDLATARELSETIGNYGVVARSRNAGWHGFFGKRSRSTSETWSEHARARIRPEEIINDLRKDTQIIIAHHLKPVICGRAIYFRRKEFLPLVQHNRFARVRRREDA
jgi:type IV secretion system protein VirD4